MQHWVICRMREQLCGFVSWRVGVSQRYHLRLQNNRNTLDCFFKISCSTPILRYWQCCDRRHALGDIIPHDAGFLEHVVATSINQRRTARCRQHAKTLRCVGHRFNSRGGDFLTLGKFLPHTFNSPDTYYCLRYSGGWVVAINNVITVLIAENHFVLTNIFSWNPVVVF